jgi:hypothetical protein
MKSYAAAVRAAPGNVFPAGNSDTTNRLAVRLGESAFQASYPPPGIAFLFSHWFVGGLIRY